jgi:hypothetical protein
VDRLGCGREGHDEAVNGCSVLPAVGGAGSTEMRLEPHDERRHRASATLGALTHQSVKEFDDA